MTTRPGYLTIHVKLYFLVFIFLIGLIICDLASFWVLSISRIKGPNYEKISLGRALFNDITVPTGVIIEPYLLAFRQVNEKDPGKLQSLIEKTKYLKSKYVEDHIYWEGKLPNELLEETLLVKAYLPAVSFFEIWEKDFLPLILRGEQDKARALLLTSLTDKYDEHLEMIEKLSEIVIAENIKIENEVEAFYNRNLTIVVATWIFVLIFGVLFAYLIGQSVTKQMSDVIYSLTSISREIGSKMDEQGQNVVQQSASIHESTSTIDDINTSFKQTESLALDSSNRAKNALKVSEDGNELLQKMINGLMGHKDKVAEITAQINRLRDLIQQIHNITIVTSNITNQTNILALNAAVQAAHAKEQSSGFSVIAAEIRKLADESKKFLSNIDIISESIRVAANSTVNLAEEGNRTVQDSIQLAQAALKSLEELKSINNSSFEGAEKVKLNVQQQATALQQILEAMGLLSEVANQSVKATEQVRGELRRLNAVSRDIQEVI